MNTITVKEFIEITNANLIQGKKELEIKNINIDSRTMEKGQFFLAIDRGNDYIESAIEKGAIAVITEKMPEKYILDKYTNVTIIKVENSIKAIQKIAKYKREKYNIPVIAITGSVGKTSTKDIVAQVVSKKYRVLKTEGNFNNHIGLPLTIMKLDAHEALVVEMGMNHFGEISVLTQIAKPTIAVITNIGTSHIGILGSRENILKAKLEILEGLKENGKIVINNDNDLLHEWENKTKQNEKNRIITYGIDNSSNVQAINIQISENGSKFNVGEYEINVPVSGTHFIYNSLCAIAVGKILEIEMEKIIEGIAEFELTKRRMEVKEINGCKIINDAYNASYESMKYALEYLKNITGTRKIAILGDMLELGEFSKELHEKVGKEVEADILITVGKEAKNIASVAKDVKEIYSFDNNEEAGNKIASIIKEGDVILLKASNGMKFGEIFSKIENTI